uniref:Uncharacterized protein n=1 Tax=Glossina palpalis gambiensis TaxID=67801 RepID=A0A1B0BQX2_9MUSC
MRTHQMNQAPAAKCAWLKIRSPKANIINEYVGSTSVNKKNGNMRGWWDKRFEQHNDDDSKTEFFAAINEKILSSDSWFVDSYASSHICCNRDLVEGFEEYKDAIVLAGDYKAKGH